jgi:lysophospholipase L1-like esterase
MWSGHFWKLEHFSQGDHDMFQLRQLAAAALSITLFASIAGAAEPSVDKSLPTIVLIGDSIRMGYAPFVVEMLKGKANVVAAKENGGDTTRVITNLDEWAIDQQPTVVHFNCGLHDLKVLKETKKPQVAIEDYETNLRKIVDRLQKETKARLVFATTTPIRDELHAKRRNSTMDRYEADVKRYNDVALKVMKEKGVEIDDLHAVVTKAGIDKIQRTDGTHYTPDGSKVLAKAVVKSVTEKPSKK